LKVSTWKKCGK